MKIKDAVLRTLAQIYESFNVYSSYATITIDKFDFDDDDVLYINNSRYPKLYCIALESANNESNYFSDQLYLDIVKNYNSVEDAFFTNVLLKNNMYQKNFIFGTNKELMKLMRVELNLNLCTSLEIVDILYELFMQQHYYVEKKNLKKETDILEEIEYETVSQSFNHLINDSAYNIINSKDVKVYEAYRYTKKEKVELSELFQVGFMGVIYRTFDFSRASIDYKFKNLKKQATLEGKGGTEIKALIEAYSQEEANYATINTMAFLSKLQDNGLNLIGHALGCDFRERKLNNRKFLKFTPLIKKDNFNSKLVVLEEKVFNRILSVHKQNVTNPNFYARDINGSYWNYNFVNPTDTKFNKNANALVTGVAGSGKTTTTSGLLSQTIGLRVNEVLKMSDAEIEASDIEEYAPELKTQHLRIFDIKESSKKMAEMMFKFKDRRVKLVDTNLSTFKYNIFNISYEIINGKKVLDLEELGRNILLISIAIESKSEDAKATLSIDEEDILKEVVKNLYNMNLKEKNVLFLKDNYPNEFSEILKENKNVEFDDFSKISIFEDSKKILGFLKVPTLSDVIKEVRIESAKSTEELRKKSGEKLLQKLNSVKSLNIFSGYDNGNIEFAEYLYMDFEPIKASAEFIPIFLALFNKMFTEDKKKQRAFKNREDRPYITYLFEEAFNLFSQPSFELYLEKFVNESRSERIKAIFVVQLISQVPKYVYSQVGNSLFLFPAENKRNALIDEIVEKVKPSEDVIDLMKRTPEYGVVLWNEFGGNLFKLDMTMDEINYFGQKQ